MNRCIENHIDFLNILLRDYRVITQASTQEIGCLVEILFNVHKIAFNRTERNAVSKFLPIIRYIGKLRDPEKARSLLDSFAKHFIRTIVRAILVKK